MKHKYEYVVNLGLSLDKLDDSLLEKVILKSSKFLESTLRSELPLRRTLDFNSIIYVENDFKVLRVRIVLEVTSSKPVINGFKKVLDDVVDKTFNYLENLLVKAGSKDE